MDPLRAWRLKGVLKARLHQGAARPDERLGWSGLALPNPEVPQALKAGQQFGDRPLPPPVEARAARVGRHKTPATDRAVRHEALQHFQDDHFRGVIIVAAVEVRKL